MSNTVENPESLSNQASNETDAFKSAKLLLRDTGSLISLPEICFRLREVLADPNHTQRDIADIISHDPALTTRLLRVVNSAFYGLPKPVQDINHALGILGEQELNNLVIVTSIVSSTSNLDSGLDINTFWRSSIFSAVMASNIARHSGPEDKNPQEYFLGGLLLNVGKLLLYYCEPELLETVQKAMSESGLPDYRVEQDELGFDHTVVGAVMAETWRFPKALTNRISRHHDGDIEHADWEQAAIYLSSYYSDQLDFNNANQQSVFDVELENREMLAKLEISEEEFEVLLAKSFEAYVQAFEAFCGGRV